MKFKRISRRGFLRLAATTLGGLALSPFEKILNIDDFPVSGKLGRACATIEIKAKPDPQSESTGILYEDQVVPWIREVSGDQLNFVFTNQRWVEVPDGYVYAPYLQPVKNESNQPVDELPSSSIGPGMWAEVSVPYVDVSLVNEPTSNSWVSTRIEQGQPLRIYYSQLFWLDQIKREENNTVYYRINPNYYGGLDQLWVPAKAMRPITTDELVPISPGIEGKKILVDVNHQVLSCYEGSTEVYYCRVSSGAKYDMYGNIVDNWATPPGQHKITRKYISLQMSGGTTGAPYDLPGIGWTNIFATGGVAIHSTFWHNNYGDTMSHGCVNVSPADAKWIFLWTEPFVSFDPGQVDATVSGELSTSVEVIE